MNDIRRMSTCAALLLSCMTTNQVVAQNPKPPTPLPSSITEDDLPIPNAVTLWIEGENLTIYVDSTSNPGDRHMLTTLEIKWDGAGLGFADTNCDFENIFNGDFDECTAEKIAKIKTGGFGPIYSLGEIIPEGYLATWSPATAWLVDGAYFSSGLDKFDPDSPYFGPVPESSSLTLICMGLLLLRRHL